MEKEYNLNLENVSADEKTDDSSVGFDDDSIRKAALISYLLS